MTSLATTLGVNTNKHKLSTTELFKNKENEGEILACEY